MPVAALAAVTESAPPSRLPGVRTLLVRLVVACLAPAALGAGLLFTHEYRQGQQRLQQDMLHTTRALAQAVDSRLLQVEAVARTLASSPLLVPQEMARFHARAQRVVQESGLVASVRLLDADGQLLLDTDTPYGAALAPAGDAAPVKEVVDSGRPVVSDLTPGAAAADSRAAVNVPVFAAGRVAYVLSAGLRPTPFTQLLQEQGLPPEWIASVLDRTGTIAGRNVAAAQWIGHPATPELRQALASEPEGTLAARSKDGVAMLTFHSRAATSGWQVAIGIPRQQIAAGLRQSLATLGLGIAGFLALGLLLAREVGSRIAGAVEALTWPAAALGRGEPVPASEPDVREAADVAAAMRSAAALLQARQRELAGATLRMSAALASISDAFAIADRDGRFVAVNDAFATVHRLDPTAGRPASLGDVERWLVAERLGGGGDATPGWALQRALSGETAAGEIYRLQRGDGGSPWFVSYSFAPMREDDGEIGGAVIVGRDITHQREREEALLLAHERLSLAQRAARAGLWDWKVDGNEITWSDQMFRLFDIDPASTPASVAAWLERLHPEDREGAQAQLAEALSRRGPLQMSYRIVLRSGELRWIDSIGQTTGEGGLRIGGICIDTTERHRAETELAHYRDRLEELVDQRTLELARAKDAAETANRSKSVFLANMNHEIRTPMNAILGLAHLLLQDETDAHQRERLAMLESSASHLLRILNDILDLSKVEAGKLELEVVDFSRDVLLRGVVDLVRPAADAKGLELVLDVRDLPAQLRGDPQYLAQALINLLSNAVKFTERGWVRLIADRLQQEGDRLKLRFEVSDTGIGIPADRHARLFSPFEQADASTTRQHGGTGLGLALTRHLALLMGGEVGLHSEPGRGSSFWFTAWVGVPAGGHREPAPLGDGGLRALVVDDLPEALEALCRPLAAWGFELWRAGSAEQARRTLRSLQARDLRLDLLVVDEGIAEAQSDDRVEAPTASGLALLQQLLRSPVAAGCASVLTVRSAAPALRARAKDAGVGAVLVKPLTASSLNDALLQVLGRRFGALPRPEPAAPQPAAPAPGALTGRRVLLVEDDRVNQIVAAQLLAKAGVLVEVAENGAAAVEQVLLDEPDLVLMDMHMPVMDGLTATRAIREAGRTVPIVAMTANAFSEDRAACIAAGMNDHVGKPADPAHLYAVLARWLAPTPS